MKKHRKQDERWEDLVTRARTDEAPILDARVLRAAVESEWMRGGRARMATTWADWLASRTTSRFAWCCGGGMAACAMLVGWNLWDAWQDLAWATFAGFGMGGAL